MKTELFTLSDVSVEFIKEIPGWPDYYADLLGNIYSTKNGLHQMKPRVNPTSGHWVLRLRRDGRSHTVYVHNLVCMAFRGPRPDGLLACHTPDPTKSNNRAENIQWQTRAQNAADNRKDGTLPGGTRKLNVDQVREIRKLAGSISNAAIARLYEIGVDNVRMIINRETWKNVK